MPSRLPSAARRCIHRSRLMRMRFSYCPRGPWVRQMPTMH
jgi:hypothetical protein